MIMKQNTEGFFNEAARRATFRKWPFSKDTPCNADRMAEAGFIFTGSPEEPDSAQCFYCTKHLDGWEEEDDPWREHLKHSPACEFAKIQKPQEELTLKEWLDIVIIFEQNRIRKKFEKQKKEVKDRFQKYSNALSKIN